VIRKRSEADPIDLHTYITAFLQKTTTSLASTAAAQYVFIYIVISPEQPFGTPYGTLAQLLLTAIGCCLLLPRKLGVATDRRQIP